MATKLYNCGCPLYTRAVCKVRGLTLLHWVGTLCRCGDGLFVEVPPLASDALLTTLHPLLENVLQTVDHFENSCLGAPFSWLEKPRNLTGRDLNWILCPVWKKWIGGTPLEHPPYSPDIAPCDFWAFPTKKREWTNCTFGLYPSSGVSKIEELKIYIPNIRIHTSTKFTQGSITNHRATYLGAYTHKSLKQVRHRWQ
jgi:hypothetical protein